MSDIVSRLRRWSIATDAVPASDIMDEAADEIERLRLTDAERAACPYVTGNVTRYCTLTPFTLTDAEREAIEYVVRHGRSQPGSTDTLRGLLERLE